MSLIKSTLIVNRLKLDDYKIEKIYSSGLVLTAAEAKCLYRFNGSLRGSYVYIKNGIPYIIKMYIPATEYRNRQLLLRKREIINLSSKLDQGYTIVPKCAYLVNNLIKLELMLCTKMKKYESKLKTKIREMHYKEAKHLSVIKTKL